jgi:hypothetical protein
MRTKSIVGKKINKLTVLDEYLVHRNNRNYTYCTCKCECGNVVTIIKTNVSRGVTKSCGCLVKEKTQLINKTHGMTKTRLYTIWKSMKARCNNPKCKEYKWYGARGIKVCTEWESNFIAFYEWTKENGYNETLSLDRIDVNGNYEPSNCRWVTMKVQERNRRDNVFITYQGETKTIAEWSEITGICYPTLKWRYHKGYPLEKVFSKEKLK